jgi:hypothetical protein
METDDCTVNADECRAKANELRERARNTDPSDGAILLMMARQYDWLAERLEAEKRQGENP